MIDKVNVTRLKDYDYFEKVEKKKSCFEMFSKQLFK